ncbi:hypothetical protein Leryth_021828 [Lithospermum erythrorhizon]|nr:hypothetical protein Leryth_021828 [Lithospermum erythrorhizon]
MKKSIVLLKVLLPLFILVGLPSSLVAQLVSSESRILFQVQQLLEYPPVLQVWNNWTNFCSVPPSQSLVIVCSGNHITELAIVGNKSYHMPKYSGGKFVTSQQTLSNKFSIDSFFTVLTKLASLKKLSLVSLGLWGPLPDKISRFKSLEELNISSNFIYGGIPSSISSFKNLKSLALAENLLNGTVPDLKALQILEELDLSNNQLITKLPSLSNSIVMINLKNNSFRSEVPKEYAKFSHLQVLDASSNKLVGPIPSFVFSLPSVQYINLARNQLNGGFPASLGCNSKLAFVDVSNNLLTGKLPACLGSKSGNRTVINLFNCLSNTTTSKYQRPNSFCQKQALAVLPPAKDHKKEESSRIKLGVVLGIIGAVIAIFCVLGLLILVIYRMVVKKRSKEPKPDSFIESDSGHGPQIPTRRRSARTMRQTSLGLPPYHVYTLEEMEDATNNFDPSNLVGEASQGQIYRGKLNDGTVVHVRCLKLKQKHSAQSLQQHMDVISKLRHRHLVSVLGHCIVTYQGHQPNTAGTVFVVLENFSNGSLRDHITDWRKRDGLQWPQRMVISLSIAKGIQYLHNEGVTGNDIKIENILLDGSLTPKISSYNISLPSKVAYEGPSNGQVTSHASRTNTEKDDIYQFGVILLEVITGRPITSASELDDLKLQSEISLAESPSKLRDFSDKSIRGTFSYESLKTAVQIAINCLGKEPSRRPSIDDVLWHMQYSIQVQEGWSSTSGNLSTKT